MSRSSTSSSDGSSNEGVLTTLLNEMDGVQESFGVTVVAATNRPEVIVGHSSPSAFYTKSLVCVQDSALTRPGRLDRLVYVGPPDLQGREEILRIRLSKMSVDPAVDIPEIALLVRSYAVTPDPLHSCLHRPKGVPARRWYRYAKKPLCSR